jgi:Ca-activated chloride channel family protein
VFLRYIVVNPGYQMKTCIWLLLCCVTTSSLYSQYYLRGKIKDEEDHILEGVRIQLASSGTIPYYSDNSGSFGIPSPWLIDTITLSYDGYELLKKPVDTRKFEVLIMKMLPATARLYKRKLASVTSNVKRQPGVVSVLGESYSSLIENGFIETASHPETGFSMSIDKASYSNIRRFLNNDMLVPVDAVRIEEMLNYFDFPMTNEKDFTCKSVVTTCPWRPGNQLLFLHIAAPKLLLNNIPPSNLVFLIDVSGSMDKPNRLPLLQSAFKLLVDNLRAQDTISIMTYGGGVGIALQPTSGAEKKRIKAVIDSLSAAGDTPGAGAIKSAYDLARRFYIQNGNNRVILATDGDFNVGQTSEKELEDLIIKCRQTGIYLTCLGVGMGNYKDSKLETLSKKGNGNFAYIDHLQEAQKVLVTEFTKTVYAVANDAYIDISFNPAIIKSYRLVGFDNKKNAVEDSASTLDGGEIGSGHTMIAVFEVQALNNDTSLTHHQLADIILHYKLPGAKETAVTLPFTAQYEPHTIESVDASYRFAAAVAMFGSLLRQSKYVKGSRFEDALALARTAADLSDLQQKELLGLIEKAIKVYTPVKQKKKKRN